MESRPKPSVTSGLKRVGPKIRVPTGRIDHFVMGRATLTHGGSSATIPLDSGVLDDYFLSIASSSISRFQKSKLAECTIINTNFIHLSHQHVESLASLS